jgi:hypothetical protein
MVSVPYLSLTIVGFLIYRGVKKNTEYLRQYGAVDQESEAGASLTDPTVSRG